MPLSFRPIPRPKVWGGNRLKSLLGRDFPVEEKIGESWEISDHGREISIVDSGRLAGHSLNELVRKRGGELMGKALARRHKARFPLLVKLIDTGETLSVQVHPSDKDAKRLNPPAGGLGKAEAWYVLHAEPDAVMYHGLHEDVTRESLKEMLEKNEIERALRKFLVKQGDVLFCPPGTVHAVGKGLVLVEVQQTSDTTLRIFDWGRAQDPKNPRPLHIKESLEVITFGKQPPEKVRPAPIVASPWKRERIVACDKFGVELWHFHRETSVPQHGAGPSIDTANANGFEILTCVGGKATICAGHVTHELMFGGSVLIPAAVDSWTIVPAPEISLLHTTALH